MPDIGVQIELKPTGYKNVNTKNEKKKKKHSIKDIAQYRKHF